MPSTVHAVLLALATGLAVPTIASAQGVGVPGCINLPEINRAMGALQGMTSACDMSVEEARRVIAEYHGTTVAPEPAPPRPRVRHPRRLKQAPMRVRASRRSPAPRR